MSVDSPTVTLEVPHEVRTGEPVPITLRVTNPTNGPLTLYLRGRPIAFDLIVAGSDGVVVWRRLEGAVIAMVLQVRTLPPGETMELHDIWRQTTRTGGAAQPGNYVVTGEVLTDRPRSLVSPPAKLRILPASAR